MRMVPPERFLFPALGGLTAFVLPGLLVLVGLARLTFLGPELTGLPGIARAMPPDLPRLPLPFAKFAGVDLPTGRKFPPRGTRVTVAARFDGSTERAIGLLFLDTSAGIRARTMDRSMMVAEGRLAPNDLDDVKEALDGLTFAGPKTFGAPLPAPNECPLWKLVASTVVPERYLPEPEKPAFVVLVIAKALRP